MIKYQMEPQNEKMLRWEGRILKQDGISYLGFTNSALTVQVKGSRLEMYLLTGENEEVNQPGLRIYVDGVKTSEIVLKEREGWYTICNLDTKSLHEVRIVKITEAAMSYVGVKEIRMAEGELCPIDGEDNRVKVEFIGDSITCGYGVHGEPESEYTIREEDGECCYASFMAQEMNWNARWISASGYGMYVEYTGDPENNVPKLYPYVNWFVNPDVRQDMKEFEPRYIFINLGTNDSGHLHKEEIREHFLKAYEEFLQLLRTCHPESVIVCVLGTLCEQVFPYVEQVVDKVKQQGMKDVYAFELPYHNVELDGMASMHPSETTHKKDAERILAWMKNEGIL
ncbi:MAG: GDSL-type esterase/lipase family protein [Clostridium sp.]|nr:GDSL-type esterase/lipase family protein [Clostridium sp.]